MDDYADESVRVINCICSAQSCKTVTLMALQGWSLCEDPASTLWVTKSVPEAKKLVKGRLWPMYDHSALIADRLPKEKGKRNLLEIYFPGYYLVVAGAENEASLQSTPFRRLNLDEVRQWKEGALEMVRKRTRRYPHNYKHFLITCPEMEGDSVHQAFMLGNRSYWEVRCRNEACNEFFRLQWGEQKKPGGLKWDKNETTKPEGKWNYDEVCRTLRFECPHCAARYENIAPSQSDRKYFCRIWTSPGQTSGYMEPGALTQAGDEFFDEKLQLWVPDAMPAGTAITETMKVRRRTGRWVGTNSNASADTRSYTWNALLPHFTSWTDQLKEFLAACDAMRWANYTPLKDHWNETRGLPWSDRLRHQKEDTFLQARVRDYNLGDKPVGRRFMTVDVQAKGGKHYWCRVREWMPRGLSRGIAFRKCITRDEIVAMAAEFHVDPRDIGVDSAFDTGAVYKMIVDSGNKWKALRGEDRPHFIVNVNGHPVKQIWEVSLVDPAIGTPMVGRVPLIPLFRFSKPATLDRLFLFMYGELGDWQLHKDELVDESETGYAMQVTAWDRRYRTGRNGEEIAEWYQKREHDHATDDERMQIAIAEINGLLRAPQDGELQL